MRITHSIEAISKNPQVFQGTNVGQEFSSSIPPSRNILMRKDLDFVFMQTSQKGDSED